jgi:ferredoxin
MPVIRFVREGRDVACYPGENLREVALREGIQLYGLKGRLGNCGGCGQCITCFVEVEAEPDALTPPTRVEELRLRRRPSSWRLACQTLVNRSLLVITRPQAGPANRERLLEEARRNPLPAGPTAWPAPPAEEDAGADPAVAPAEAGDPSATSDEALGDRQEER